MLTITEAMERLIATVTPQPDVDRPLEESFGLTLAEDVYSKVDSPPFDKSLMDGYAIGSADLSNGTASFRVIEVITAGQVPTRVVRSGEATQIMTGAPIPEGADAVIKVEETSQVGDIVSISTRPSVVGTNIIRRGASVRSGTLVLGRGLVLNGARIGALAELGHTPVRVCDRPQVAILATGDELVPIQEVPGPGQIRNSNEAMLAAQVDAAGGIPVPLGIARDNHHDLQAKIRLGLQYGVLILSGGVSAGTRDLVPSVLAECGVIEVFHKVEMKPGKPIWFGVFNRMKNSPCYVFGLPGNPVSSLICCELFVRVTLRRMMGIEPAIPRPIFAKLEHAYSTRLDRPTYHPARLTWTPDGLAVTLVKWQGSSDLCGTVEANGMALLSGEARQFYVGDPLETWAW